MRVSVRSYAMSAACIASLAAACGDPQETFVGPGVGPGALCGAINPPLQLGDSGRVLTDVLLEVQLKGIVMKVIVDDPDGVGEFASVTQELGVFQDPACQTATLRAYNQIVTVGTPVTFGTVVRREHYPELYAEIAGRSSWPVRARIVDTEGETIDTRVRARVVERRDEY